MNDKSALTETQKLAKTIEENNLKLEHLKQEIRNAAKQVEMMLQDINTMAKQIDTLNRAVVSQDSSMDRINTKLGRAFQWWNQNNCSKCGKRVGMNSDRCGFCQTKMTASL